MRISIILFLLATACSISAIGYDELNVRVTIDTLGILFAIFATGGCLARAIEDTEG